MLAMLNVEICWRCRFSTHATTLLTTNRVLCWQIAGFWQSGDEFQRTR